jgi:N-acetylglutamate synthase-like GNAT family acetyltransferase
MKISFDEFNINNVNHYSEFYNLNIEWLQTYFYVEDHDKEVLNNPKKYIIDKGGIILFVLVNNMVIGTVALMPTLSENTYELTKMAIKPDLRGKKIGQKLMTKIIRLAKIKKINKLILYSNRKLKNAIHLYKKFNFKEIDLEEYSPYKRANIKMELII